MDRRAEQSYRERIRCCLSPGPCRALHWALLLHGGCVIGSRESLYSVLVAMSYVAGVRGSGHL